MSSNMELKVEVMDKFYLAAKNDDVENLIACIMENQDNLKCFNKGNTKTGLHVAIENGNLNIVEILLWIGADPSILDEAGLDCLKCAQFYNQIECVNLIISQEIRNKSLYQSCCDIISKGCSNWFSEFIKFKRINGEPELDIFYSVERAYDELIAENFKLSNEIKGKVEVYLIDNNYNTPKWTDNLQECYNKTKSDLLKICEVLKSSMKTELFILKLKMFLKYFSVIKLLHLRLKYSKVNLCWTQLDFLISLCICIQEKRIPNNFIYMNLDKKLIISYIQLFLDDLKNIEKSTASIDDKNLLPKTPKKKPKKTNKNVIKETNAVPKESRANRKLIPKEDRIKANKLKQAECKLDGKVKRANKIRKELKKDYNHFKNILTIERLNYNIQIVREINISEDGVIGIYAIRRVLQMIGEGLKSTENSPNISKSIVKTINDYAPKALINITTNLRDGLSHGAIFHIDNSLSSNALQYSALQKELLTIVNILVDVLFKERSYGLKICFHKILKCEDTIQMNKLIKYFPFEENISGKYCLQMKHFSEKWKKFCSEFETQDEEETTTVLIINECLSKINVPVGAQEFQNFLSGLNKIKNSLRNNSTEMKKECLILLQNGKYIDITSNINYLREEIAMQTYTLINLLKTQQQNKKKWEELEELLTHLNIDISTPLKSTDSLNFYLEYIPPSKILQQITNIFNSVLKENENRTSIEEEIKKHKNIYVGKKKIIDFITKNEVTKENCAELENMAKIYGIEFKNVKGNYLKGDKFKANKNVENMTSIYGKLVKDMKLYLEEPLKLKVERNAIEKFFNSNEFQTKLNDDKKWIEQILSNHRIQADQKIMEYLLKLKNNLFELIPLNNLSDEKLLAEEYAKYKENIKLQLAVEMILFEILQIIFEDDDDNADDSSIMLSNRSLRNYLAHGNIFFNVFKFDPTRIIFMNVIKLLMITEDFVLTIDNFRRYIKGNINTIYGMSSSWIEKNHDYSVENNDELYEINDPTTVTIFKSFFSNYLFNQSHFTSTSDELTDSYFFPAISMNNLEIVKIFCKRGINVNQIHPTFKVTPLYTACHFGDIEIVIELLKYDADISICNDEGFNSLAIAIYFRHTKIIEYILDYLLKKDEIYVRKVVNCVHSNGLHILKEAIQHQPIKIVQKLVSTRQIDINMNHNNRESFLHVACKFGRSSIVRYLIAEKANIDIENQNYETPVYHTITFDNIKILKILLKERPNLNGLLHKATAKNNLKIVKLLIKNNADVNEVDEQKRTILHIAIVLNFSEIAIYLIENKIFDLNFVIESGETYLSLAAGRASTKIVESLIQHTENKTNVNPKNGFLEALLEEAVKHNNFDMIKYLIINGADMSLYPYLQIALNLEDPKSIILLLECGINVNNADSNGNTPLHYAVSQGSRYYTKMLIDFGAETEVYERKQLTPLMVGIIHNHIDIVLLLLNVGAQINTKSMFGWINSNIKEKNIKCEYMEMVKLLIENEAVVDSCWDVELTTKIVKDVGNNLEIVQNIIQTETDLFTPLQMAIINDDLEAVNQYAIKTENINCANSESNLTPVLMSVVLNKLEYVKILVEGGADVNSRYYNQNETSLIFASELGNYEMVETLLKAGANVNAKTIYGRNALFYAAQSGNIQIVRLLIQYGAKIDKIMCISLLNFNNLRIIFCAMREMILEKNN